MRIIHIYDALKKVQKNKIFAYNILIYALLFVLSTALMNGTWNVPLMLGLLLTGIAGSIAINKMCLSQKILKKELEKLLEDKPYRELFLQSIEEEIEKKTLVTLYRDQYKLTLYMTDVWLVLISTRGSIICRRDEIFSATKKVLISPDYKFALRLKYISGKTAWCYCENRSEELAEIISKNLR